MTRRGWMVLATVALTAVLLIGVPVAVYVSFSVEQRHACVRVNNVRRQLLSLVDSGVKRSKALAEAPQATPTQKANYVGALAGATAIHKGLPFDHC